MRTQSSGPSYATTEPADIKESVQVAVEKALAKTCPAPPSATSREPKDNGGLFSSSPTLCPVGADHTPSGLNFVNKTYVDSAPGVLHQSRGNGSEVQMPGGMLCESAYQPSTGDTYQPAPACPLVNLPPAASSPLLTDMLYQPCNPEPGRVACESFDERNAPPEADYQPFQALVEPPGVLFSEKSGGEEREHSSECPEESRTGMPQTSFDPVVPGFTGDVQGNRGLSERQQPSAFLIPMDSDYQSV